jgi:hypothetical protein
MYNTEGEGVQFYFGEVVQNTSNLTNTYKRQTDSSDSNNLFCLTILVRENNNTINIENVKPAFPNIKQIPIIGENVLVFRGYDFTTSPDARTHQWYYFPPVGIGSGINSNVLPINSHTFTPDVNFVQRSSPILQPYRGDILLAGRYGNSLRLSSTIPTTDYDVQPNWTGKTVTDPIIILSNTTYTNTDRKYVVENIEQDVSSLYLTSTQTVPIVLSNNLESYTSAFNGSQLIATADRIILRAKTDIAILDSKEGIILNTDGDVLIGSDAASEPIPHGNVLVEILQELISAIGAGSTSPGGPCTPNGVAQLQNALTKLNSLNSSNYKIKKT